MCGICGFYDKNPDALRSEAELVAMGQTIHHRGPDSFGSTLHDGVGLHNRRLKIIDLEGGDQPIFSEDGQLAVVYNGEIFNFPELKKELEDKGYRFRTRCDTEVLIHLYEEYGPDRMLQKLNGFFAFALHDRRRRRLMIARDRVGVKPLFYSETPRGLVFGSELKTMMLDPAMSQTLDPTALVDFLCLRYIPAPKTIFQGVKKLPAGHYLLYDGKHLQIEKWWDLPEFGTRHEDPKKLAEELWELILDAVRLRLIADVPLGAFLSGGLDSSGVVTAMQHLMGNGVKAVSIGFENWDQSELQHAVRVAEGLGIEHIPAVLKPEVLGLVDTLAWHFDEPFADPSAIPTFMLAQRTRQEVTVALSGDGGDECYAGYRRYRFDALENQVRRWLPGPLFRSVFAGAGKIAPKGDYLPRPFRVKTTLQNLGRDPLDAYVRSVAYQSKEAVLPLLREDIAKEVGDYDPIELFRPWFDGAPTKDPLSRVQYVDFHTYLPDYIMCKTDRATMANSLEAREPLLDYRLVEFAARLPSNLKLRGGVAKWILKQALKPHLPPATIERPKQGFSPPLKRWINEDLRSRVEDLQAPTWIEPKALQGKVQEHMRGLRDHSELLYEMLILEAFEKRTQSAPSLVTSEG